MQTLPTAPTTTQTTAQSIAQTTTHTSAQTRAQPSLLPELALFDVTGADATTFLQGQLTQDVATWQAQEIKRAAWCNPKGRMLVSFYIWQIEAGFRLVVARDLVGTILPRLRMFVLRSKVSISEPLPADLFATTSTQPALSHADDVFTVLNGYAITFKNDTDASPLDWTQAHIHSGVAWISAANREQFVPQTTNFELVGGVNFRKGCFPGQEVVARSQYLGKLKLRAAIASVGEPATALQDVFEANASNPVGRVIQASANWILFEAPQTLIESSVALHLGSPSGALLHVQALPYPVLDVTA